MGATTAAAAMTAKGPSLVIYSDKSIGGFATYRDFGRLSHAIAVFGEPEFVRVTDKGRLCHATWPTLGLTMMFFTRAKCTPEASCVLRALITGKGWRTAKGLRIGDRRERLYRLYPNAKLARSGWRTLLIRPAYEGTYPAVQVKLVNKRVRAFRVAIFGCEGFQG